MPPSREADLEVGFVGVLLSFGCQIETILWSQMFQMLAGTSKGVGYGECGLEN